MCFKIFWLGCFVPPHLLHPLVVTPLVPGLSCGVVCAILHLAISVELRLVTDRQTQGHSVYHASISQWLYLITIYFHFTATSGSLSVNITTYTRLLEGMTSTRIMLNCGLLWCFFAVFTLGNNAYGQCGRKIIEKEDHRSVSLIFHLFMISQCY